VDRFENSGFTRQAAGDACVDDLPRTEPAAHARAGFDSRRARDAEPPQTEDESMLLILLVIVIVLVLASGGF
jgi:hypothetical protein